jgi:hypothetical protein
MCPKCAQNVPATRACLAYWQLSAEVLSQIRAAEGRYPTSSDPDPERRRLASWLSVQRRTNAAGTLSQDKLDALRMLPNWDKNQRKELGRQHWNARMNELKVFKAQHDRWPRHRNALSEAERVLGVWLHGQRQSASRRRLAPSKLRALDSVVPGWNTRAKSRVRSR